MKKLIMLLAISALLAACGEEETEPAKEPEEQTETSAEPEEQPAEEEPETEESDDTTEETVEEGPQEMIEKALKEELDDKFISLNGVFVGEEYFGQIELKGAEGITQNLTVKGMKLAVRDALAAVRDSGVDASKFSNLGVSVKYPLVSPEGETSDEYVIKADFTGETVAGLDDKANQNNIQNYASSWWEHPAIQQ